MPDGSHRMRFCDSLRPDDRKKPEGVIALQLHMAVARQDELPTQMDPAQLPYVGGFTKSLFNLSFPRELVGKSALMYGRWTTRTALTGPWSQPLTMLIAMGSTEPNVKVPLWGMMSR